MMPARKRGGLTCPYPIQASCFVPDGHRARRPGGEPPEARGGSHLVVLSTRARGAPTAMYDSACSGMLRRGSPEEGIRVAALSLDEASTRRFISRHGSTFPVGPSADGPHVRELTGAFVNPDPESIQETGFVLPPDGRVVVSVYFGGVIGRLTPEEVMGLVRYLRLHDSAAGCPGYLHRRATGWPPQESAPRGRLVRLLSSPTDTRRSRLTAGRSAVPTPIRILPTDVLVLVRAALHTKGEPQ
jgi:hypothetical protein